MAAGLLGTAVLLNWEGVWLESNLRNPVPFALLLLGIGPGYVIARGLLRLYLHWNRLRRRRMVWSLTHAHLTVVTVVGGLIVVAALVLGPLRYAFYEPGQGDDIGVFLAERFFHTLFPTGVVALMVGAATLVLVLPPSALFSFIVARRTTQRLENLTAATAALHAGYYSTRVEVEGEDEVAQLQADFNAMAADLERTLEELAAERDKVAYLLEVRRELVANVSHELRTPVATIRGYLESLRATEGPEPQAASLDSDLQVMEGEVLQLQRLIDDLFTLSRAEVGGLDLNLQSVDLGNVIRRRVKALAPLAWERERIEVVAELLDALPLVRTDEGRFDQVLANLLRNALRHTDPGGIVVVVTSSDEEAVRVEVRDTGEGIPPEELPHVWDRFYRGDEGRARDTQGAGLGLALVRELTEAMGGKVEVESRLGEGSCFAVTLPRV
jgi:signal transduction histidine kinase